MSLSQTGLDALRVVDLRFDPDSGELFGPAGKARLPPKPAALLALLAEDAGRVVDRDRITERLWPGGKVEFDQGIAFTVREVRKAIEGVGADPAVVETIPRRGLRLVSGETAGGLGKGGPGGRRRLRDALRGWGMWAFSGLGLVALAGAWMWLAASRQPAPVVIVFPYAVAEAPESGSGARPASGHVTPGARALSEALTVRLTEALGPAAGVIGPNGAAALEGPEDTEGARSELSACLVLSGAVRGGGPDTMVVFTQLVRTSDRVHVWAGWDTVATASDPGSFTAELVGPVRRALGDCRV